ncbi:sialic acid-binding Ig-like lectin 7 [Chelmon rostratus]|uniref:sialic acid-binding Ig-like lectin 7 n=1 Tax=Chelmon rostratus TaxID=109905 RepID=UPI001BE7F710|nr:sialic acid-binding Ig-like lectin 7 [Chelmon rostratus]XP_041817543.1 sialic acid-binding Ig-like lectin 7 [Chelmon rostratus]
MVTASMFLTFLFVSGVLADCQKSSALFITAPQTMEALSGSCLQIPCTFSAESEQEFDGKRETFGVWIKSDSRFSRDSSNVIFNSSKTVNNYPMRITGNLIEKNCTTSFSSLLTGYTDKYFFRVENKPFMATASCDPLQLTVRDSPASPRIEISGDLKEQQLVTITCSAFTPCPHSPPKLTWTLQQDSLNEKEQNKDGTFTTKIMKSITLSDQHDGFNITCSAAYPVNEGKDVKTAEERETLSVSYAPKNTSVSVSVSGSWVNLTCSSRAKPPVSSFTWFRNSEDGAMNVSEGQFYSLNVTDGGVYYCVAKNGLGQQKSLEVDLTAEGAEQPGSSSHWGAAVGGVIGNSVLIFVVVAVWRLKSKHPTSQQAQGPTGEEPAVQERARATEKEDIHYGEIDFSRRRPEVSSSSVQDSGQQQDMLYAQVKASKPANSSAQTADGPESIYAQVKKK